MNEFNQYSLFIYSPDAVIKPLSLSHISSGRFFISMSGTISNSDLHPGIFMNLPEITWDHKILHFCVLFQFLGYLFPGITHGHILIGMFCYYFWCVNFVKSKSMLFSFYFSYVTYRALHKTEPKKYIEHKLKMMSLKLISRPITFFSHDGSTIQNY